jgi:hypothetical protein
MPQQLGCRLALFRPNFYFTRGLRVSDAICLWVVVRIEGLSAVRAPSVQKHNTALAGKLVFTRKRDEFILFGLFVLAAVAYLAFPVFLVFGAVRLGGRTTAVWWVRRRTIQLFFPHIVGRWRRVCWRGARWRCVRWRGARWRWVRWRGAPYTAQRRSHNALFLLGLRRNV